MRISNHKLGEIVYHDQFFEYFNELRNHLNLQPDDNAILRGLRLSLSGTNVNVTAGWATGKPVFISFIKNNLGDTIRPISYAVATGLPIPDPFNGFVFLRFTMSSMVAGAPFYDITAQVVLDTAPTAAFPTGSIIGEVCLGSVSRTGAVITISGTGRDFNADPAGTPVNADSYDASTDSPPLANMPSPTFYRVGTAGPQIIDGKNYNLGIGDLVFRDANGYSVISKNGGLSSKNLGAGAVVSISDQDFFSITGATNQAITLFPPSASPSTKYVRFTLQVLHNNVTVTPAAGLFSGVASRTFNKFDWVVMSHDGTDWYMIS